MTKTIAGSEILCGDMNYPTILYSYEDYLFLGEMRDTARIAIYKIDGDTLRYVKGLINRGRGPHEFYYDYYSLSGDSLFVSNSDPTGIKSITGISLENIEEAGDFSKWKEYSFSESDLMTGLDFAKVDDGKFIVACGTPNTRQIFSLADFNSSKRIPLEYWPNDSTRGPMHAKQMVYMHSRLESQRGRIAYANCNARYMFIADIDGQELVIDRELYSHLPQYKILPDENVRYSIEGEFGIDLYSTSKYIYASLGRTVREYKEEESYKGYPFNYMDEIEVYDWNGKFIDNYQTDRPFYSFVVSSDDKYLFTTTEDLETKEPCLLRYDLKL